VVRHRSSWQQSLFENADPKADAISDELKSIRLGVSFRSFRFTGENRLE
jgi:hypothetical protein